MPPVYPFGTWVGKLAGQPTLPSFYWNVYSYEQRIKEIVIRLSRVIKYADYLGAHVNELIELVNNLSAKVDEMNDQIADLNKRLEEEIKRAQEAEKQLQANIDAEETARKEADQQLQANIDAEAEARQEADERLQAAIDAEEQARQQADQQLQSAIDAINGKLDAIQIESNNLYTASTKLPTVQAIINSTNQPISDGNKLATMADVNAGGGGGGTTVNSIAPLTVETAPETQASESYAFGNGSEAGIKAVAIGETANATGQESVAVGNGSLSGYQGTAIGYNTRAENNSVAIGRNSQTTESDTVSVGATDLKRRIINVATPVNGSDAATKDYVDSHSGGGGGTGDINIIAPLKVETAPTSVRDNTIAIGNAARSSEEGTIAIGHNANTGSNATDSIAIGTTARTTYSEAVAIGILTEAGDRAVAIGSNAVGKTGNAVAIGNAATTFVPSGGGTKGSVAIGYGSYTNEDATVSFGAEGNPSITASMPNTRRLINVSDPVNAQDAATKAYVDAHAGGGGGATPVIDWANISRLASGTSAFNASGQMIAPTAATANGYVMLSLDFNGADGTKQPNDTTTVQATIGGHVVASGVYAVNANSSMIAYNPSVIVPVAQGDSITVTNTPLGTPTTTTNLTVNMWFIPLK